MSDSRRFDETRARVKKGGHERYHQKNAETGKLFARKRIELLVDTDSFIEDALYANAIEKDLPADGVITGTANVGGRVVAIMANDSTIKAGSWGAHTVEKILRLQDLAVRLQCPVFYLVDSAGARITDQVRMFPGRRGAGHIFYNEVQLSGQVPQICLLFGPSAAGGAYIPAFCDVVIMVEGNASMYLGSPRMAEVVIGEKVSLEEMGGARMHCSQSGCGDFLVKTEEEAIALGKRYLSWMPQNCTFSAPSTEPKSVATGVRSIDEIIPADDNAPFDMMQIIHNIIDDGSWLEIKALFAKEILTGLARIEGKPIGIVANQSKWLGGILFVDSADKSARFIQLCNAFNIPLIFLADVPGFMIGTKVERQGIIRAGAKMVSAVSMANVPKLCVVVRKAYGAGLYAMCGPAFEPDATLALPQASIAVMGPSAAVNAVFYNKLQEVPAGPERDALTQKLRDEYKADVDLMKLASEMVVDDIVQPANLRAELCRRLDRSLAAYQPPTQRKHMVMPM